MDIIILLLITLLIYLLPQNKEYLNVKSTSGLRGFLAIGIIFHHLSQWVTSGDEFSNFSYMGTYIVSIFFFLSAYGLYFQNENKKNYLDNFLVKRLSKILVPFFSISLIYMFYRFLNGQLMDLNFFANLFKKGSTIIYNGWFVDIIILMYIFFYISFKFFRNKSISIVINTIFVIGYICLAIKLGYSVWWYNSALAFVIGLIWAKNQNKIDRFLDRYYIIAIILVTVLLFFSHKYNILL
ncbi:MAG: acyltransferase family protein, partial [Streptococcus mitis]|nr:acyltransferase family protein [Streptococcus mitis]